MHATVVSLDEVGTLPDETYGDILRGFIKCSNEDFKAVFQHLLTQKRIDHFSSRSPIATSSYGPSSSERTIAKIKHIHCNANDLFYNFSTSKKWVVNGQVDECFNCGGDHATIIVMSIVIRIILHRTRLSLKKKGTMLQVVVAIVEDVLVVVGIIRAKAIMKGTSLE